MPVVTQPSGHTIHAEHIEKAKLPFFIAWDAPAYINVLYFEPTRRWCKVLAETAEGAMKIAKYHHFRGSNFELLPEEPEK